MLPKTLCTSILALILCGLGCGAMDLPPATHSMSGPIIVSLQSRDILLRVISADDGLIFDVLRASDGAIVATALSEEELSLGHPDVHRLWRRAMASTVSMAKS